MATKTRKPTSRAEQRALLKLSPFEVKDKLMALAAETEREGQFPMLNAGRGNPNWLCTTPREAFGTLLRFAIEETRRDISLPDAGRMPEKAGSGARFAAFLDANRTAPGAKLLRESFDYGVKTLKLDPDTFAHELADGIIGDMYPVPGRMLRCIERIVHEYLMQEMCGGKPPAGRFDLFAVEGGTAAMCYIFNSLMYNGLLQSRGHHRPGRSDVPALHRDPAPRSLQVQGREHRRGQGAASRRHALLAVRGRGDRQAGRQADQGVLPGQPEQSAVLRDASQLDAAAGQAREEPPPQPDDRHRRRVRHLRPRLSVADGRAPAADHRGLLVLEALRVHRLAPRGRGDPPGQHLRQDDREAARQGRGRRSIIGTAASR